MLALVRPGDRESVSRAAKGARVDVVFTATLAEMLARLSSSPWSCTLLSLSVEHVDESVVRRVGEQPGSGELIASCAGASLQTTVGLRAAGIAALLREPIDDGELTALLLALLDNPIDTSCRR